MEMKTYKNLDDLETQAIANNGSKVTIWDDNGIKVNGHIYRMFEYGDYVGNSYVTFINKKGTWKYGVYYDNANYITIHYKLKNTNEFELICVDEVY